MRSLPWLATQPVTRSIWAARRTATRRLVRGTVSHSIRVNNSTIFGNKLSLDCFEGCPCFKDCPNGCEECPNPICKCNEPQIENSFYRHCMEVATDDQKRCLMESAANEDAYTECWKEFKVASRKCPCNSECSTGCPCEDGYKCQEFVMAMCQEQGTSSNPVNYTYVISADGLYQETI